VSTTPAAANALPYRGGSAELSVSRIAAYFELTKPRITALILLVTVAGFWLGSRGAPDGYRLLATVSGIAALAAGMFALNQYFERHLDALMSRTSDRPLPAGRLKPRNALVFGTTLCAAAVAFLALKVNLPTGVVAAATIASYLFVYTPLKTKTPHCTLIGAFPGAVPPLVGWVAARGELGPGAWALFAILFLWQFPHFHSIAWLYRDDYARAGIRLWPVVRPQGTTTAMQVVCSTLLLLPVSVVPGLLSIAGTTYMWGAAAMGIGFAYFALRTAQGKSRSQAQRLLLASVLYLPALFILMVLGRS
jgi:heme o synthase